MTDPIDPSPAVEPGDPVPPPELPLAPPPPAPRAVAPAAPANPTRWIMAALIVVLAVSTFITGTVVGRTGLVGGQILGAATPAPSGSASELALIEEAWRTLHEQYVDAKHLDDQALAYGAIRGMTDAVGDPGHTTFLTKDAVQSFDQSLSGTFVGIGVQISTDAQGVIIASVLSGTPAQSAGLHRGDRIVAVDGKTTTGETIDEVVARVRGPEGESVTLSINRAGSPQFDVSIVRKKLDNRVVTWAMVPGRHIAMIRLDQFSTGATKELKAAIEAATGAGATAIVFDLRGDGGGYVSEAVGVASQFVGDGIVYQSIDASGTEKDVAIESGGEATKIPMVVLADGQTASAAEIVSGAIQDAGRAKVVGEKTFGTGTVTGRYDLADGSALRIGTERWLTRGGHPIWHEGLDPDVPVALPAEGQALVPDDVRDMTAAELAASSDAQLLKALDLLKGSG